MVLAHKNNSKTSADFHDLTLELLTLLNNTDTEEDIIKEILCRIKRFTKFDAVGIRLNKSDDYPYYETMGFDEGFIKIENTLCTYDENCEIVRDKDGRIVLGCICGNIIRGRVDRLSDCFTEEGSFWTNCTSDLNKSYFIENFPAPFRFICFELGYESMALIPIKSDSKIIGLLQLNHKKRNALNLNMIENFEKISNSIGIIFKRKRLEKKIIEQKAKIEYKDLQNKFFAKISHEFRTPVTLTLSVLKMLEKYNQKYIKPSKQEKTKNYLSTIRQNNFRLLRLINNLLDIIKMDAGTFNIKPQNHDIVGTVREVVDSVQNYLDGQRYLSFVTEINKKVICCDKQLIIRVILNLLSNSVKFTDKSDSITVSVYENYNDDYTYISLKDSGIGLKEDKRKLIFDKLRQADESFSRHSEGLGMGLTIAQRIIAMHEGEIVLESQYRKGSKFIIKLPNKQCSDKIITKENDDYINNVELEFSDIYV